MKEEKFLYTKNPLTSGTSAELLEINNRGSEDKTENSLQKSARSCFTEKPLASLLAQVKGAKAAPWPQPAAECRSGVLSLSTDHGRSGVGNQGEMLRGLLLPTQQRD